MVRFLSEDWVAALAGAFDESAIADAEIVIEQKVTGAFDGDVTYWLSFDHGEVNGGIGNAPSDPDVTITQDYATAVELSRGEVNAQAAFMQGKLKVTGNMGKLLRHQAAIQAMGAAMASLNVTYEVSSLFD